MARTVLQIDLSKNKVAKLSYSVRGTYQILRNTGLGIYFVRKLNKPDSPELKFMAHDLYPLPPSLKPCKPIDSTDARYLNQNHTPLVNPLKKPYVLNSITRNGLLNQFQLLILLFLTTTIHYSFPINLRFPFLQYQTFTMKLRPVPRNYYLEQRIILYLLPHLLLNYRIPLLILIVFSSFNTFLKTL